ncbi:MAG: metallophosphoesterase, partial [bacterium]|nr:metallophosphoesterase [bacterium]
MKYMVISDIHGDIYALDKVLDIYVKESCSKLLILGDLFSYNSSYHDSFIIDRLNSMKNNIICVRGNCDYDISLLEFNMPYIENVTLNNKKFLLT